MFEQSDSPADDRPASPSDGGRRWRSVWRIHFYAGMFSMPFIVLMALTGLVILYTQPIQSALQTDLRHVEKGSQVLSYDTQAQAVHVAYPKATVTGLTVPSKASQSTIFSVDDGSEKGLDVFVDPYTASVLGTQKPGSGVVGLSNRLHGYLNNNSFKLTLPSVGAVWDHGAIMRPYIVGDMVLELLGVWTLVLVMSGIYLWWPRKRLASAATMERSNGAVTNRDRKVFGIRRGVTGRARWRDMHGLSGVLLLGIMLLTIVSGLAWSSYWSANFTALANRISPNTWTDAPSSAVGSEGDLDVLGNQIPWNSGDRPIPESYASPAGSGIPAAASLGTVAAAAERAGMKPGFIIHFPKNPVDATTKKQTYGSFTVSNSWPRKTGEARDLFLDQFSAKTLDEQTGFGYGAVSYSLDTLVSTHMGTQLGLFSRVLMTALCVLSLWSVTSAMVMYSKRRRPGTLSLPRRPVDVRLTRRIAFIALVIGIVYPLWGASAMFVLAADRFIIRRNGRLRALFGQR